MQTIYPHTQHYVLLISFNCAAVNSKFRTEMLQDISVLKKGFVI